MIHVVSNPSYFLTVRVNPENFGGAEIGRLEYIKDLDLIILRIGICADTTVWEIKECLAKQFRKQSSELSLTCRVSVKTEPSDPYMKFARAAFRDADNLPIGESLFLRLSAR